MADSVGFQFLRSIATNNASPLQSVAKRALAGSFSAFSGKLETSSHPRPSFELKLRFILGPNSIGISPKVEAVTLQVGTFAATIPPGSFSDKNGRFVFEGAVNAIDLATVKKEVVHLDIQIKSLGDRSFVLAAESRDVDLTALANPVSVALTVGDDTGLISLSAEHD